MDVDHQQVGDALVAFPLKMVLGGPESVITQLIHQLGEGHAFVECSGQVLVGEPPVVDRSSFKPNVVQVDVPGEQASESGNHLNPL